ncbi:MAG TPA: DUF4293 domain-containing protein, partial [Chitinophagales bacterium]|nr:DUF4293 domain-containing protein [Chitinophagales bacterium]
LLYFIPIWETATGGIDIGMESIGAGTHLLLLPLPVLLVISHLIAIFSYKNRKRQKRFCIGNILLYIIFLLWALLLIQLEHHLFQHFNLLEFRLGVVLPLAGIILNILARNGIKKDEALLRSMDRLR